MLGKLVLAFIGVVFVLRNNQTTREDHVVKSKNSIPRYEYKETLTIVVVVVKTLC
jgi:hypothetical protein